MLNSDSALAVRFWRSGKLEDCPIIDVHGHLGEYRSLYLPRCDAGGMVRTMDECGVRLLLFCGHAALTAPCVHHQPDIDAVRAHPDRLRAYFAVNANAPWADDDLARLQANPDVFVGLKMLPSYFKRPINDDAHTPFFEYANHHGLLFLCHTWGGDPFCGLKDVEQFVGRFPNIVFIAGHAIFGEWQGAARLASEHENVYLDTCAVLQKRGAIETLLEHGGCEKILFGTDIPWFDPHQHIGDLLAADMTDDDRSNILHRNAERLLSRYEWFRGLDGGL